MDIAMLFCVGKTSSPRAQRAIGLFALLLTTFFLSSGHSLSLRATHKTGFGEERVYATHREVDVWWRSEGSVLAGTLYLPIEHGSHPAIVFHFGSSKWTRIPFDGTGIPRWVARGVAVLSYDKRGVGKSQGKCCPWQDPNYFPLLGNDLLAAVRTIRSHPDIDSARIGLFGFSQGGWVVPTAAAAAPGEIAFTIIGSGPAVPLSEELLFSRLTGDNECRPSGLPEEEIERRLSEDSLSGFDPTPYLERMEAPGLWVYGNKDTSIPVKRSVATLHRIASELNRDFTVIVLPVNHEWIVNGAMCQSKGPTIDPSVLFDWLMPRLR
jgi:uncharacterized protein